MNYWLVKLAPFRYSWQDILKNGKFEIYSVRNAQARNNLKEMKLRDEVLFYQSQEQQGIMGKMKVIEEAHQDKTTSDTKWVSITFEQIANFEKRRIWIDFFLSTDEMVNKLYGLEAKNEIELEDLEEEIIVDKDTMTIYKKMYL